MRDRGDSDRVQSILKVSHLTLRRRHQQSLSGRVDPGGKRPRFAAHEGACFTGDESAYPAPDTHPFGLVENVR